MITAIAAGRTTEVRTGLSMRRDASRRFDRGSASVGRRWTTWARPSSYLALSEGMPVYSSDGKKLGEIEHVLAEPEEDIFDGFVIDTSVLPGGHRFVDAPEVGDGLRARRRAQARRRRGRARCPSRARTRACSRPTADDAAPGALEQKLGRAWDLISGQLLRRWLPRPGGGCGGCWPSSRG